MSNGEDPAGLVKPLSKAAIDGVEVVDEGAGESELTRRANVTRRLADGRDFLEAMLATRDFFSSRTLGEQIARRVATIGDLEGKSGILGLEGFDRRVPTTLQARLSKLEEEVLDALEQAEAIIDALPFTED